MSQVKMVALRRHPFGVGTREKGEEYTASEGEAKILVALKWARPVKSGKVSSPSVDDATSAPVATEVEKKPAAKKATKRTYRTRDMKAKD